MIEAPPPMSRAVADDHAGADPALDHRGAEGAGVEVDEALVHHGRARGEVRAQPDPVGVGDPHAGGHDVVDHPRELVDAEHGDRRRGARSREPQVSNPSTAHGPADVQTTLASTEEPVEVAARAGWTSRCESRCRRRYASAASAGASASELDPRLDDLVRTPRAASSPASPGGDVGSVDGSARLAEAAPG